MNQGKYIFAQLTDFLPRRVFDNIVSKYDGNKKARSFTCWNQMLCMIFGQLAARDSMRDLMLSLEAHKSKYYHLGLGASVTRTNLGKANRNKNIQIKIILYPNMNNNTNCIYKIVQTILEIYNRLCRWLKYNRTIEQSDNCSVIFFQSVLFRKTETGNYLRNSRINVKWLNRLVRALYPTPY